MHQVVKIPQIHGYKDFQSSILNMNITQMRFLGKTPLHK